jgi:hypothetical protein
VRTSADVLREIAEARAAEGPKPAPRIASINDPSFTAGYKPPVSTDEYVANHPSTIRAAEIAKRDEAAAVEAAEKRTAARGMLAPKVEAKPV